MLGGSGFLPVDIAGIVLSSSSLVTLIVRNNEVLMPRGSSHRQSGDHVFVALPADLRLSFSASTSLEQLHRLLWGNLPDGLSVEQVSLSLGGSSIRSLVNALD